MVLLLFLCLGLAFAQTTHKTYGAYFVNWAQYRASPYTYTASNLQSIISRVDEIYYGFIYFCPPAGTSPMPYWAIPPYGNCNDAMEYQLLSVDPKDDSYLPTITGYRSINPNLKVYLSIGGWNFPSEYFSKLAASTDAQNKFTASALSWLSKYNVDGIDIDWEFPCSPPRTNPVEISCTDFQTVNDAGGSCPADTNNLPMFAKALKGALGSKLLTFASQAAKANENTENIAAATPYIDKWHIMTYDYQVSDITDPSGAEMSPNCPLYTPKSGIQMSVNQTVSDYLAVGVPPSKIMIGMPLYGHTWYQPALVGTDNWKSFGGTGIKQNACCGPFADTYGAKYGQGSNLCGTMMYSEIQAAKPDSTQYDTETQTMIGFFSKTGADSWTQAGTWLTYNDVQSVTQITQWSMDNKLDGVFIFDTSEDSIDNGQFTYELMNTIADTLGDHGSNSNVHNCNPSQCNVCSACCDASITTQDACDNCVATKCNTDPCSGKSTGSYCVNQTYFVDCPQGVDMPCAPGTCCQQAGDSVLCGFCYEQAARRKKF